MRCVFVSRYGVCVPFSFMTSGTVLLRRRQDGPVAAQAAQGNGRLSTSVRWITSSGPPPPITRRRGLRKRATCTQHEVHEETEAEHPSAHSATASDRVTEGAEDNFVKSWSDTVSTVRMRSQTAKRRQQPPSVPQTVSPTMSLSLRHSKRGAEVYELTPEVNDVVRPVVHRLVPPQRPPPPTAAAAQFIDEEAASPRNSPTAPPQQRPVVTAFADGETVEVGGEEVSIPAAAAAIPPEVVTRRSGSRRNRASGKRGGVVSLEETKPTAPEIFEERQGINLGKIRKKLQSLNNCTTKRRASRGEPMEASSTFVTPAARSCVACAKKEELPRTAAAEAAIEAAVQVALGGGMAVDAVQPAMDDVEETHEESGEVVDRSRTAAMEAAPAVAITAAEYDDKTERPVVVVGLGAPKNLVKPTDRLLAAHRQSASARAGSIGKRLRERAATLGAVHKAPPTYQPTSLASTKAALATVGTTKAEVEGVEPSLRKVLLRRGKKASMASRVKAVAKANAAAVVSVNAATDEGDPALAADSVVGSSGATAKRFRTNALTSPDHREHVLFIFMKLAEINSALGERYKAASYTSAVERLKKEDTIFNILPPHLQTIPEKALRAFEQCSDPVVADILAKRRYAEDASQAIPGVGDKLRRKIVEILATGDLSELHVLEAKPIIRAIQELTQVHGFGPRTAIAFYKDYGIKSVAELKAYDAAHEGGVRGEAVAPTKGAGKGKKKLYHLTDAQRMGLRYHKDIMQRIPHREGRLHEAFLKLRLRKFLGRNYELVVCGSYRRQVPTSGDIDVLITHRTDSSNGPGQREKSTSASHFSEDPEVQNALANFVSALQAERYIEATLAQGPTKFMGVCRLRALSSPDSNSAVRKFTARRIDIRFVDAVSYPAALMYFTGSKNFNVVVRAKAIQKGFILNEYGLFRNNKHNSSEAARIHTMIGKLARAQYFSSKRGSLQYTGRDDEDQEGEGGRGKRVAKSVLTETQLQELRGISRQMESLRVPARSEQDIFDAIGMEYVSPEDRNV